MLRALACATAAARYGSRAPVLPCCIGGAVIMTDPWCGHEALGRTPDHWNRAARSVRQRSPVDGRAGNRHGVRAGFRPARRNPWRICRCGRDHRDRETGYLLMSGSAMMVVFVALAVVRQHIPQV
ncbi:hypothetical protein BCEP4_500048 [Burkholderia cepacia]|nr:hypothetical protein BCEP4_500048 [Burkholderia cepacia]